MIMRKAYLESRSVLADSGSKTTDINLRDPITAIWVEVRAGNGTTGNQDNLVAQNISAIEIIDGSEVIFSLNGEEALANSAYFLNQIPNQLCDELKSNTQNANILIPFGRFLYDPEFAFDPTKYMNPQVRITWNFATVRAVGVTGFTSGTGRVSIVALVMEGAPKPRAVIMTKETYTSAGAASGDDYIDLPRDYRYQRLMIRAYKTLTAVYSVVSQVKLSLDADAVVPHNMRMTDTIRLGTMGYPMFHYRHNFDKADGDYIYTMLKYEEVLAGKFMDIDDTVLRYTSVGYGEGVANIDSAGSAETSDVLFQGMVQGYCPFGVVNLEFGRRNEPSEWLPVPDFRSARLILTQGAASATIAVMVAQHKPY